MARIGIDLGGCCYDFSGAFARYVGRDASTIKTWRFYEDWNMSLEQFTEECQRAIFQGWLFKEGDLIAGTRDAFVALKEAGHEIHIVTDRLSIAGPHEEIVRVDTERWLAASGLQYDSITYSGDKLTIAKQVGLDYFIDDKVENVADLSQSPDGPWVWVFDQPWNRDLIHQRVYSWDSFVRAVGVAEAQRAAAAPYKFVADSLEVTRTSSTGGAKGQKMARIGSLDPKALLMVGEVAGFGEQKYSRLNYMKGYDWSLTYDAGMRHRMAFWNGEDFDPESGLPHLAHAAWHDLCLLAFFMREIGTDDRYKGKSIEQLVEEMIGR